MTRRHWLALGTCALAACREKPSKPSTSLLRAGPFEVTVPVEWSYGAGVQLVPMAPLYSEAAWATYSADSMHALKPGYCTRPEHWAIRFPQLMPRGQKLDFEQAGDDPTAPQILIHKAKQWAAIYNDGKIPSDGDVLTTAGLRKRMDSGLIGSDQFDSPAAVDGSLTFVCLKKALKFRGGRGVRMVCQWAFEPTLVQRGELHYLFLGMSDDDTCQIIATFPLEHPELPKEDHPATHLGWSTERYSQLSKDMDRYESEAIQWIVEREHQFTPKLSLLDAMMESMVATKWE
jgi:hypothetical protein